MAEDRGHRSALHRQRSAGIATAAGLLVLGVVMPVAPLVPTNFRAAHWMPVIAPVNWRERLGCWGRLPYLWVAVVVTVLVLLVAARV